MSQWTHVCGCIRIDAIVQLDGDIEKKIKEQFGNCVSYYDDESKWNACNVPCGSEGSVQYRVEKTADSDSSMSWGVVYIWGDLRNYDNHLEIFEWIVKSCDGLFVRSCAVKIDVEYKGKYLVHDVYSEKYLTIGIQLLELK
jgi:hypothetical protein